ncbi:MAG: hypothetical protein HQM09_21725 [Candidatus Riflebacteria bacterium]|nr:hypothetical protein [Candidatus Riflebacteria bacterium]
MIPETLTSPTKKSDFVRRVLTAAFGLGMLVSGTILPHPVSAETTDPTVTGLSGTLLVPGLEVMPPGSARGAVHLVGKDGDGEGSMKGIFSFSNDTEIAINKRFVTGKGKEQLDPMISAKFKVRPNVAMAAVVDTTPGYKSSVMLLTGVPGNRLVVGLGANIAVNESDKLANFGQYTGNANEADPFFILLGGTLHLDPDTDLTMDYTGNDFVIGLRHHIDERVGLDFGYYTPDRLHGQSRSVIGATFGF